MGLKGSRAEGFSVGLKGSLRGRACSYGAEGVSVELGAFLWVRPLWD